MRIVSPAHSPENHPPKDYIQSRASRCSGRPPAFHRVVADEPLDSRAFRGQVRDHVILRRLEVHIFTDLTPPTPARSPVATANPIRRPPPGLGSLFHQS